MGKEELINAEILEKIESNSISIEKVIKDITEHYSADLDEYVAFVKGILQDDEKPPSDIELQDFCLNLSTLIYYTSVGCEQLGIRDDIARSTYKEAYNIARDGIEKGTVADKNAQAELHASQERIVSIIYEKSYKILKAKTESAQELLSSCKKIISARMTASELSRTAVN